MSVVETVWALLVVALLLGVIANRFQLPYAVALVVGGMGLAFAPELPTIELDPEIALAFFLPPILYQAALFTSWREFHANIKAILSLAVGLVVVTTIGVAVVVKLLLPDLPWAAAFVLGAIVSPPDAVAASAVLSRLRIPKRIVTVLEGESLINDASGLVLYKFAVAAVLTGAFSMGEAVATFVGVAAGGVVLGLAVGWLAVAFLKRLDDPLLEITFSLLLPMPVYLIGEHLHVSGVLAVVTAGLLQGWHAPEIFGPQSRLQAKAAWDVIIFILNSLIFILIGLQLEDILDRIDVSSVKVMTVAIVVSLAAIAIRMAWIFPAIHITRWVSSLRRPQGPPPPWRHGIIVGWTGMRGVVSLAAALALPLTTASGEPFPGRDLIIFLTFAIIFMTLVGQGTTLSALIRWLGVIEHAKESVSDAIARRKLAHAALEALAEVSPKPETAGVLEILRQDYKRRMEVLPEEEEDFHKIAALKGHEDAYREVRTACIAAERRRLLKLRRERQIDDEAVLRLQWELDLEELRCSPGKA